MQTLSNDVIDRNEFRRRPRTDELESEVLQRAKHLLPQDKMLIELAVKNHLTRQQLAQILKIAPGNISRRLVRVGRRLNDPLVIFLLDPICPLPAEYRQLAIEHFLQGLSHTQLAERHQMHASQVRRMLEYVKGWFRGMTWRNA